MFDNSDTGPDMNKNWAAEIASGAEPSEPLAKAVNLIFKASIFNAY